MNTYRRSATMPTAAQIAAAIESRPSGGWYRTAGFCHGKTARSNKTLAFRDTSDGYIQVKCFAGCTEGEGWRSGPRRATLESRIRPGKVRHRTSDVSLRRHQGPRRKALAADPVDAILDALVTIPRLPWPPCPPLGRDEGGGQGAGG